MKKVWKWLGRRAREKETWAGLAVVAGALGAPQLGVHIEQAGQLVAVVLGTGLAAATTRPEEA